MPSFSLKVRGERSAVGLEEMEDIVGEVVAGW